MVHLRPARPVDAGALGDILYTFQIEMYGRPKMWSGAETIAYCGEMIDNGWVTVAEVAAEAGTETGTEAGAETGVRVVGFLARDGEEVCSLYVAPGARGAGVGQRLMDAARETRARLWLRVMAYNAGARRFYRRNGFSDVGRSDGSENEENLPAITMEWRREGTR
ncbi:N-acetyltransferase [Antarcticimicrobium luteum]